MAKDEKALNARDALIKSAKSLFSERGYHPVSTRELADHAGVNLGAIPYHFGSKANLFIETVREMMKERHARVDLFAADRVPQNREEAASTLCCFIREMLADLCNPNGPDACRIMFREIASDGAQDPEMYEALVSSVVEEFIKPIDSRLVELVGLLSTGSSLEERGYIVHSLIGQCAFYMTHRPFVQQLRGLEYGNKEKMQDIAEFIASHNLRALGFSNSEIKTALQNCK